MLSFNVSQIGTSHIEANKPCQDAALSFTNEYYSLAVVADGHGTDKCPRSDKGSFLATVVVDAVFTMFMSDTQNMENLPSGDWMRQVAASIISLWQRQVEDDFKKNPCETSERISTLYGTTLIVAVQTARYFFAFQIGDGTCITMDSRNRFHEIIPHDDRCFLNRTTSLCDEDALNHFRYVFMDKNLPIATFVATDGMDNSFAAPKNLFEFYRTLNKLYYEDKESAYYKLKAVLPKVTEQGSRDDISIAGIYKDLKEDDYVECE